MACFESPIGAACSIQRHAALFNAFKGAWACALMALAARSDNVVEMLRGRRCIELFDGLDIQGGMLPKMRVDHACIGGVVSEQIMGDKLLATPIVIGVGHG